MSNKILELTEKIYNEGVVKAKVDADQIIAKATEKANEIIKSAKKQEIEILENANKQALDIKKNCDSEMQLAARQFTSNLKQKITTIITTQHSSNLIKESFKDIEFIKNIILTTIQNWNPQKPEELDLKLLLPEKVKKELTTFLENKTLNSLNKGVTIEIDSKTKTGFKIAPLNGNYTISFNENDFENFFKSYFRERTKKLLFESES
jgi:V/A-type H+-transporting ATPase subunit E